MEAVGERQTGRQTDTQRDTCINPSSQDLAKWYCKCSVLLSDHSGKCVTEDTGRPPGQTREQEEGHVQFLVVSLLSKSHFYILPAGGKNHCEFSF